MGFFRIKIRIEEFLDNCFATIKSEKLLAENIDDLKKEFNNFIKRFQEFIKKVEILETENNNTGS